MPSNSISDFRQCAISVMDNLGDPDIRFDKDGICNYYYEYLDKERRLVHKGAAGKTMLDALLTNIRRDGVGKPYDCILGVSGGVDSTYLAFKAKEWGLRPLLVHFDNGWNSELAVMNIRNIIQKTGFDLYTYVVDWDEFKDIQKAFFAAHVIDIEAITDIGFVHTLQLVGAKHNINYVIDGQNVVTEGLLPNAWIFKDIQNLINIHKRFGSIKMKTYPMINVWKGYYYRKFRRLRYVSPLNYVDYDKQSVKEIITREYGWRDYGGKHYESVFTRFYQGHILPGKFGVDKRKAHLSNLIFSGQLTKQAALEELAKPAYDPKQEAIDKVFVLKKLGFGEEEFAAYMKAPVVNHRVYGSSKPFFETYSYLKPLRPINNLFKKLITP